MEAPRPLLLGILLIGLTNMAHAGSTLDCAGNCMAKLSALEASYPAHGPIRLITENVSSQLIYVNVALEYQTADAWPEALASVNAPPGRKHAILALVRSGTQFRMTLDPDQPAPSQEWKMHPLRFRVDVFVDGRLTQKVYSSPFRLKP